MKHIYLINPAAGRGDTSADVRARIEAAYADADEKPIVYLTTGMGDATRFVHSMCQQMPDEQLRFYACGGDGTLGETVTGAAEHPNASVGLVPIGTGNDFVRNFTSSENFMDIEAQRYGEETTIDLIRCNGVYCVNLFNTGFDCEVVVKMTEIKRSPWVPAGMAYGAGVAFELIRKPGVKVELSIDGGEVQTRELLLCAVGNGAYYGGGFMPVPFASLSDGMLDMCIVNNVSRVKFVSLVGSYKRGQHVIPQNGDVLTYVRCRRVDMVFPELQNICMDGEVKQMRECHLEVVPSALRLCVPRGSVRIDRPAFDPAMMGYER